METPIMNCILKRNPYAGFLNEHRRFCTYCDEDATHHVNAGHACMNVCGRHAKKFPQAVKGAYVEGSEP